MLLRRNKIEYKLILAALIDSEEMLLSIEAQLCTCRENVSTTKTFVSSCVSMLNNICSEDSHQLCSTQRKSSHNLVYEKRLVE